MKKLTFNPFSQASSDRAQTIRLAKKVGLSANQASDVATARSRQSSGQKLSDSDRRALQQYRNATDRTFQTWRFPFGG